MMEMQHLPSPDDAEGWPDYIKKTTDFIKENTTLSAPPLVPELQFYLAGEMTPLWKLTEKRMQEKNVPPPFWSFAWPGGQALARIILDRPSLVAGKRVFDFASGSGIVALAAKKAGAAEVTASDLDPTAIVAMMMNAKANGLEMIVSHKNWLGRDMKGFDVILAGDVFYEWPMAMHAEEWLRTEVKDEGIDVLFGDPGRNYVPREDIELLASYDVPTSLEVEDKTIKHTKVYRLLASEE